MPAFVGEGEGITAGGKHAAQIGKYPAGLCIHTVHTAVRADLFGRSGRIVCHTCHVVGAMAAHILRVVAFGLRSCYTPRETKGPHGGGGLLGGRGME